MGIKMKKAIDTKNNNEIFVKDATEIMREQQRLICITENCKAKLTWAELHKNYSEIVTRYFRLLPGEIHKNFCRYNTIGYIEKIVAESDDNIIKNIGENQFEFRLNLVHEAINEVRKEEDFNNESDDTVKNGALEKKYIKKGNLKPYLSTMKKIMQLRSEIESNGDLKKHIKLIFNKGKISWDNFYFEDDRFSSCYDYINTNGQKNGQTTTSKHPICIEGRVKKISEVKNDKYSFYSIEVISPFIKPNSDKTIEKPAISIRTKNVEYINEIKKYEAENGSLPEIAVYTILSTKPISLPKEINGITTYYKNIIGWVYHKNQYIILEK